jgi:type IV pilus assembly protein PilA
MRTRQTGFSLIELLVVVAIILIVAVIAIPNLLRSRMAANEASALASVRSINTSQVVYQSSYGPGFAKQLADLSDGGVAANCVPPALPTSTSSCLIDSALGTGTKSGYIITYGPLGSGTVDAYTLNADPVTWGSSGQRYFFSDQSYVIRANTSAAAVSTDPPI